MSQDAEGGGASLNTLDIPGIWSPDDLYQVQLFSAEGVSLAVSEPIVTASSCPALAARESCIQPGPGMGSAWDQHRASIGKGVQGKPNRRKVALAAVAEMQLPERLQQPQPEQQQAGWGRPGCQVGWEA